MSTALLTSAACIDKANGATLVCQRAENPVTAVVPLTYSNEKHSEVSVINQINIHMLVFLPVSCFVMLHRVPLAKGKSHWSKIALDITECLTSNIFRLAAILLLCASILETTKYILHKKWPGG